jgi:hypothetical protein
MKMYIWLISSSSSISAVIATGCSTEFHFQQGKRFCIRCEFLIGSEAHERVLDIKLELEMYASMPSFPTYRIFH